ncbi:membrane protein [Actinoplanes capillaceus]|uniref:Membrane protein n=1 Tax=Actinoplanes campanulatus TaxID=113559 RepID=A0ABQ3WUH9_9ACTN|nr:DUF2752 domain-containing protein [Actinoplanes capillaceus]GID49899.1 membrane protein [Actinoplanes capillaceus]
MPESAGMSQQGAPYAAHPGRRAQVWGHRLATIGVLAAVGAAAAFVHRFDPTDRVADPTGACLWHTLTGINGPGCGGTRMFYFLIHADLVQAARHHLVVLLAIPLLVYAFAAWFGRAWFGVALPLPRIAPWMFGVYAVVWLVYAVVLRNLPGAPFSWFAVPDLTP